MTVQQGGGGFMRHATRTPTGNSTAGHFYGVTVCKRRLRPLRMDAPPRPFTATTADPKATWNNGRMNRYCPACIEVVAASAPPAPLCPECVQGKHGNCNGQTLDDNDEWMPCATTNGEPT